MTATTVLLRVHEAANKYKIPEREIRDLIGDDKLPVYDLGGEMLVNQDDIANIAASRLTKESFAHLEGVAIGVSEAALKYRFHIGTISQWVSEGHIRDIGPDPRHKQRRLINEADVAYAAALRDIKGLRAGKSLWQ